MDWVNDWHSHTYKVLLVNKLNILALYHTLDKDIEYHTKPTLSFFILVHHPFQIYTQYNYTNETSHIDATHRINM